MWLRKSRRKKTLKNKDPGKCETDTIILEAEKASSLRHSRLPSFGESHRIFRVIHFPVITIVLIWQIASVTSSLTSPCSPKKKKRGPDVFYESYLLSVIAFFIANRKNTLGI